MTREEKIISFFTAHRSPLRWCDADMCGCMGCINGSSAHAWKRGHPEETPITREEFELLSPHVKTNDKNRTTII
jgi:hypothetical protein